MPAAGLLLTGGASRRMGHDKASLRIGNGDESLSQRTARLLVCATSPTLEVGPGHTSLGAVADETPGLGPLAAVVWGRRALQRSGWEGQVVVIATDLPLVTAGLLDWLAGYPSQDSVVPVARGRPQPLCARYSAGDLEVAEQVFESGRRAMHDLLEEIDPFFAGPEIWQAAAGGPDALRDVDSPADFEHIVGRRA